MNIKKRVFTMLRRHYYDAMSSQAAYKLIRTAVSLSIARMALNFLYNKLSIKSKVYFHPLSRAYRVYQKPFPSADKVLSISFGSARIKIPLSRDSIWLDWDTALSIAAHDWEIKQTYANLLKSRPPKLFVDIGANYGTHSLLHLCNNIPVLSFEPNPECVDKFLKICKFNNVHPRVVQKGLSQTSGYATLSYSARDTWLGKVDTTAASSASPRDSIHKSYSDLKRETISISKLDNYSSEMPDSSILIKIDTEGSELDVLLGGKILIKAKKPLIIFEENGSVEDRSKIYDFFKEIDYSVGDLPFNPSQAPEMSKEKFVRSTQTNFIAVPPGGWS